MRVLYERCAAIDVGNAVVAVAVRLPGDGPDGRVTRKKMLKTFYGVLREAAGWLTSLGVTHVAMEATGTCSMPVYHALLEHGQSGQVLVCNAGHVKNVPGRKAGMADAEWLAHLLECGLLRGSFIPPAGIKAVRDVIRYRTKVVQSRSSEIQRLDGVLQDAGIKLGNVTSSIASKSGRNMIGALTGGERRPGVLADLAIGRMRSKAADLAMALEGRFGPRHALMCRLHLDHIAHLEQMIAALDAQVETMMRPYRAEQDLLATIPASGSWPPPRSSPRSAPTSGPTSPPPPTWPPGPGSAPATTSPPASSTPGNAATAASTSSPSSPRPPGRRPGTRATSGPSTTGTS
jgi:transposase